MKIDYLFKPQSKKEKIMENWKNCVKACAGKQRNLIQKCTELFFIF